MVKIASGSLGDSFSVGSLKAYLSEFIATLLFVFAGVGSAIAYSKLTADAALDPPGLVAVAVAHAFALFVGVSVAANISGGHLNPAVTFGLVIGGNISILSGLLYWIAQCLGSIVACLLLKFVTSTESIPTHGVAAGDECCGRSGDGDCHNLCTGLHRLRYSRGSQKRVHWNHSTHCNWVHCGC
ncbi:hypothetical protein OIU77_023580 [Salix suchowensis]|uniref:Uncharacterized protein n=1 Tax=Salix suchowensis TaxID=1278906 RepID=A0ABQ9C633_9ROSI|nr:hypothetical protein OIU78_010382 [Salix suchowensis]KAJ6394394.1 hypothetical protein OIU77_023580 [Salix suchowensis]